MDNLAMVAEGVFLMSETGQHRRNNIGGQYSQICVDASTFISAVPVHMESK